MLTYRCCDHCAEDPEYHENYPPDSHGVGCGYAGCEGNTAVSA